MALSTTVAVVFDFDDTLVPDSTTSFLQKHGLDPDKFWKVDLMKLVKSGYDPTLGYMRLILDNVGKDKPLGLLRNSDFRNFGTTLDDKFYPGIPDIFDRLRKIVKHYEVYQIEFYIVSGGLREIVMGSNTIRNYFSAMYGCEFGESGNPPRISHLKRAITFTEKTRYLFEINKGLAPSKTEKQPYLVNRQVRKRNRRIPFSNMVYVGDGLTDIPCFSLLRLFDGTPYGVFDPTDAAKAKAAFINLLKPKRVISTHAPRYRSTDELGALLEAAVSAICQDLVVKAGGP